MQKSLIQTPTRSQGTGLRPVRLDARQPLGSARAKVPSQTGATEDSTGSLTHLLRDRNCACGTSRSNFSIRKNTY